MLAKITKDIDGTTFEIGQLPLKDARAVLIRLTRTLGPTLMKLAGSGKKLGDADSAVALGYLMTSLSEEDLEFVCEKFGNASNVTLEGGRSVPVSKAEAVFQGRMMLMFKWLWACAEHNYSDLFLGLAALSPSTPGAPAAPSA